MVSFGTLGTKDPETMRRRDKRVWRNEIQKTLRDLEVKAQRCEQYIAHLNAEKENFNKATNSHEDRAISLEKIYLEVVQLKESQNTMLSLLKKEPLRSSLSSSSSSSSDKKLLHTGSMEKYEEMKRKLFLANLKLLESSKK